MYSVLQVGFEDEDSRDGIWGMLFAILYVTNIKFLYNDDSEEGEIVNEDEVRKGKEDMCDLFQITT